MKKILTTAIVLIQLTSCKKTTECRCVQTVTDSNGTKTYTDVRKTKNNKKKAEKGICSSYTITTTNVSDSEIITNDCKIK